MGNSNSNSNNNTNGEFNHEQWNAAYAQFEANAEIYELKHKMECIERYNNRLKRELDKYKTGMIPKNINNVSTISSVKIDDFVTKLMADPESNIDMIPDFIE